MSKEKRTLIEELTWPEVRDSVTPISKKLVQIIDDISPSNEFTVFKVRYPYGAKILDKNILHLPYKNNSTMITDSEIDKNIKEKLTYDIVPLGIITKNTVEQFYDIHRKIFSIATPGKGLELGISEHLGCYNQYSMTSGARSVYMLPKISETLSHKQLKKKFGITLPPPKHLYDHWQVFTQVANSDNFPNNWFCEVIYLSKKWAEAIKSDESWHKLALYINEKGWQHSAYGRKKAALELVWEVFVRSLSDKELKFDSYIVDTLKHLVYVAMGAIPASAPCAGKDEAGPLKNIQAIYEDAHGYGLGEYIATIMQPQYFTAGKSNPVYYSLQLPALLESLPRTKKLTSVIDNVRELDDLLNCFIDNDTEPWMDLIVDGSPLNKIIKKLQIDYFHGDMFAYGDTIKSSLKMPESDQRLLYTPGTNNKKRVFASNSSFLRGCVKISSKPTQTLLRSSSGNKGSHNM